MEERTVIVYGYMVSSNERSFKFHIAYSGLSMKTCVIPQNKRHYQDAELYDGNELLAFELEFDCNDNVIGQRRIPVETTLSRAKALAVLADGKVLCDNGHAYEVYRPHKPVNKNWQPLIDSIGGELHTSRSVYVYYDDSVDVIYGFSVDDTIVGSWEIEDAMASYLNGFSCTRYNCITRN